VRWCSYTPATEPVLQSIHYARSGVSRSGAVLRRHQGTLFNQNMEPKESFFLKNHPAKTLHRSPRESLSLGIRNAQHRSNTYPRMRIQIIKWEKACFQRIRCRKQEKNFHWRTVTDHAGSRINFDHNSCDESKFFFTNHFSRTAVSSFCFVFQVNLIISSKIFSMPG